MLGGREEGDVALLEIDDLFEMRLEVRVVRSRPRLDPRVLRRGDRLRLLRHELGGHTPRLLEVVGGHRDGSI